MPHGVRNTSGLESHDRNATSDRLERCLTERLLQRGHYKDITRVVGQGHQMLVANRAQVEMVYTGQSFGVILTPSEQEGILPRLLQGLHQLPHPFAAVGDIGRRKTNYRTVRRNLQLITHRAAVQGAIDIGIEPVVNHADWQTFE